MVDDRSVTIYGLRDPRTDGIRYIGKTVVSPNTRLRQHINNANRKKARGERTNHKDNWVLSLVAVGLEPQLTVLETVPPEGDWAEVEIRWIAATPGLTNDALGGQGPHGFKWSDETRAKLSATRKTIVGWHHSEETKRKIGEAQKGKICPPMSEGTKQKISASSKGREFTDEHKQRISEGLKGRVLSEESKAKISTSLTGKERSIESRQKQSRTQQKIYWPVAEDLLEMKETMTYREIGDVLGISPNTVQTRIWRLRERGW